MSTDPVADSSRLSAVDVVLDALPREIRSDAVCFIRDVLLTAGGPVRRVGTLAHVCDISRRTLYRHVHDALGISPQRLMSLCLIAHAAVALREMPEESIAKVARRIGYRGGQFTLSNAMKRDLGVRPTQARAWTRDELVAAVRAAFGVVES